MEMNRFVGFSCWGKLDIILLLLLFTDNIPCPSTTLALHQESMLFAKVIIVYEVVFQSIPSVPVVVCTWSFHNN